MICFLTSSPMIPGTETLNPENGFTLELRRYVPENCRAPTCPTRRISLPPP